MIIRHEIDSVETSQAVLRADPKKTVLVLTECVDILAAYLFLIIKVRGLCEDGPHKANQ